MDIDMVYEILIIFVDCIGAHGAGETPVLIPNTAVKPSSGDYTAQAGN